MTKLRAALSATVLLTALCAHSAEATPSIKDASGGGLADPVRIMPLGDSITHGGSIGGYRLDLGTKLRAAGRTIDFVGSMTDGPASMPDRNHEGHPGWTIAQIDANVVNWLRTYNPRTILLHIGTNDMYGSDPAGAPRRLSTLIDRITAQSPNSDLFVATIIPIRFADQTVRNFNNAVKPMVRAKASAGKRVHLVDMYPSVPVADLPDGIHPNAAGYSKMATTWYNALRSVPGSTNSGETSTAGGTDFVQGPGGLPNSFRWSSSGVLISPKPDSSHQPVSVKDPSVVYHNGKYHVFASIYTNGYNMIYTSFSDWSQASSAPHYYLDRSGIGSGYRAAPQVFYFAPQRLWYLVYQTGAGGSYSTTTDISRPETWSAPRNFYSSMPQIIRDNIGNGYWVDFWNVCDSAKCYLFSSDDNGHLYRSETTLANFPNGFTNTVIAMQDPNRNKLFEAANVYKIQGSNTYLLVHEAIGSDGRRWFRSWTAPAIIGPWTALADTESNPFARANNVTFPSGQWTRDISHGEMIRSGTDQIMEISPCDLRYVYQGLNPNAGGEYNRLPWRLGLLTQTNSAC
ncbi:non-reducing end alpha-L-arabinofuranosidase family hydrolase [Kibdelosporangium aridum]|nr:non-reducing end alpha-L-arabinofuranosidase family hydrolase [Kibdelosporangium aridum]